MDAYIVVERPKTHHKGQKEIARWPYGDPVPPGIIIGKDTFIRVEYKGVDFLRQTD